MVQLCQTLPFLMKTIDFLPQLYKRQCFWLLLTNLLGVLIKIVPDEQVWEIIRSPGSHTVLHILQPCIMNRAQEGKNNIFISRISIFSLFSFLTRWHYILQYIHLSFIEKLLLKPIKFLLKYYVATKVPKIKYSSSLCVNADKIAIPTAFFQKQSRNFDIFWDKTF